MRRHARNVPAVCSVFEKLATTYAGTVMRSSAGAFRAHRVSNSGCRWASVSASSFCPTPQKLLCCRISVNAVSGIPPRATRSRYASLQPSSGLIAARCGGCSAAVSHWDTAR